MPDDTWSLVRALDVLRDAFCEADSGEGLQNALESARNLFAQLYCQAIGLNTDTDQAKKVTDKALENPDSRGRTRWSQQVLAYYAYYVDLLHKLRGTLELESPDPNYIAPVFKHKSATAYLAKPEIITNYLAEAWLVVQRLNEASPQDLASAISASYSNLVQREGPVTPELAALRALLKIWTTQMIHNETEKLPKKLPWKPEWLPVPYQGQHKVRVFAEIEYKGNASPLDMPALDCQEYTLEARVVQNAHTHPSVLNRGRLGRVSLVGSTGSARVEIEWELELSASCLPPPKPIADLALSVRCPALRSVPWDEQIELRKQHQVETGGSVCSVPEISSIELPDGEATEGKMQAGLESCVKQAFVGTLAGKVCVDPRCGRFIWEHCIGNANLAKKIIWKAVEQLKFSDFWYLSRDQVDGAVRALVDGVTSSPTNGDWVDISDEIRVLVLEKLEKAGLGSDALHNSAIDLLDLIAREEAEPHGTLIDSVVSKRLLSSWSKGGLEHRNITRLISQLVDAEILVLKDGRVRVASGFIAHWAKAKRAELA